MRCCSMPDSRDRYLVEHIASYCSQIAQLTTRFGNTFEAFEKDEAYKSAAAFCVLQIGELVKHLSGEFKKVHSNMPWEQIIATRNIVVHGYGRVDKTILWETITDDIPQLYAYCLEILRG